MNTRSKKRKDIEGGRIPAKDIGKELKKVKRNDSDSPDELVEISRSKGGISSLEKLLKESEDVYDKFVDTLAEKENENNELLEKLEADLDLQKQEGLNFLKNIRQVVTIVKGDEKIEQLVGNLEKECEDMREKVKDNVNLKNTIEQMQKENHEIKKMLKEAQENETSQILEMQSKLDKMNSELKEKVRKEKGLQSIVELYYSLTNLRISTDYSSQDPISEFHCSLKGESSDYELEFKLKDNEDNEIEYNPIKCELSKAELQAHSYLQEEIIFDLANLKKFFKATFESVNKE